MIIDLVCVSGRYQVFRNCKTMSEGGGDIDGRSVNDVVDDDPRDAKSNDTSSQTDKDLNKNYVSSNNNFSSDDTHDQLMQMVVDLKFQNEYLKSHFQDLKNVHAESKVKVFDQNGTCEDSKELHEKLEALNRELVIERQTRGAAEAALEHLRAEYSEADSKSQELSAKLAEVEKSLEQQVKERDEKNSELDSKLNRLHKRAKQRIQEVQKEKDDLEAKYREVNEKSEQASLQLSELQQELDRTRQHANEALKAIDTERQQLRSANNRLRDNIEELRRSMEPKENAIETLQQSLLEKEQMLDNMRGLLQAAEEKKQASLMELSSKHQQQITNLEAQLAESAADRTKATETISTLQRLVAEKESKLAEMDAASTGESARLKAAMESIKGEITHLKHEHENEKEKWEATSQALSKKLEIAEGNCIRAEIEAAKMKSQMDLELSLQSQRSNTKDAELVAAKEEIKRLESEFASYKSRAHALLQKKDAELASAKDNEQVKALEEALKEAENEILLASSERDKALQDLENALTSHEKTLIARDEAFSVIEQQVKNLEAKLTSTLSNHQTEKESWEKNLQNVEETWQLRFEALKSELEQQKLSPSEALQKEVQDLQTQYKKLKEEHDSFRDLADKLIEEKDTEITRLTDNNKNLLRSLQSKPLANNNENGHMGGSNSNTSVAEQQILILARQQAQREEELAQSQRHILALQEELEELERENRLHSQQEALLKEELRNMERSKRREGVDMTYLKNVIVKLLETGEVGALLPVIAMLLQFSPDELQKCQNAYRAFTEVPPSPGGESPGAGASLFSRFSFT
ncbi:protein GRIP [Rutidosis leptorrhynchoides]|uniref:protein GRIP n=1 Tax=Rutidosis leptorrhynchoides TaxID=125765 RepID=UPI003A99B75B